METGQNVNITEFKGKDNSPVCIYCWEKVDKPKTILQIFHGMAEHAGRYGRLAGYLNAHGIVVIGHDHRGHGKTSQLNGKPGVIGADGFNNIVEDGHRITAMLKEKYPDIPVFILAHSFGSFAGQQYITQYGSDIAGIILSGSAAQIGPEFRFAKLLAFAQMKLWGEEKQAKLIERLSFGSYNRKIQDPQTGFDWLSRDAAEVKKYIDDEYCGFTCSAGFYYYFTDGLLNLYKKERLAAIPKNLPIYIIAGDKDPVGMYGKRVQKLYDIYKDLGIADVSIKLYKDSRHEILNEMNREEVTEDILRWINIHI